MKNSVRHVNIESVVDNMLDTPYSSIAQHQKDFFAIYKFTEDLDGKRTFINGFLPSFPGKSWDRFLIGAKKIADGERLPLWLEFAVTGRCPCKCWHCYRSDFAQQQDLTTEEIKTIINEAYDIGTAIFGITGGEPMEREDIIDICRAIPDGMEGVLYTTGYKIDNQFAALLKQTNVTRCQLSLDHYEKEIVNSLRSNPQAYDTALKAIEALKHAGIYIGVTFCITDDICEEEKFNKYMHFVNSLGIDEIRVILPIPQGQLKGRDYKKLYLKVIKWTREMNKNFAKDIGFPNILLFNVLESWDFLGCSAGFTMVSINNDGYITPCTAIPLKFANVRELGFKNAYDKLAPYFKTTGKTCYGKRIAKLILNEEFAHEQAPFSVSSSEKIASAVVVSDKNNSKFYENLKTLKTIEENVKETIKI